MKKHTPYQSIIFIGKTGSGKGTQAYKLATVLGYDVFSIGDKTRATAAEDTELGRYIRDIQVSAWIPEWLASYWMTEALVSAPESSGLVFESVARKPQEAEKFHEIHEVLERPYIVLYMELDDETAAARMRSRNRDASDSELNIPRRLQAFKDETMASIAFFEQQGTLITINAAQDPEDVHTDILSAIT